MCGGGTPSRFARPFSAPILRPSIRRSLMIPTSTRATINIAKSAPASADAVAVFVHKQSKPEDTYPSLPQPESQALSRLLSSCHVRAKSNEVTVQLLDGK